MLNGNTPTPVRVALANAVTPSTGVATPEIASMEIDASSNELNAIIELLRCRTRYDFRLYKTGTLRRRIERRMAAAALPADALGLYLTRLQDDPVELRKLADYLLINVTRFFRDAEVFDVLAESILPRLLDEHAAVPPSGNSPRRGPLRLWVAGCSTGEETYSLAILFSELIKQSGHPLRVQIFASDVDRAAIDIAREGLYPFTIEADVSASRLSRFFRREEHGYRVLPELRTMIVFAVQDILVDPPFARMDMVSCRNVLIYLGAEAQAKIISMFHFALREDGILLLGHAETVGETNELFEAVDRKSRIYRHRFRARPGELGRLLPVTAISQAKVGSELGQQASLADLCRRSIIDTYAPAAILVDGTNDCLYSVGPTDAYLRVVVGHPSRNLLAMLRHGLQVQLGLALKESARTGTKVVVDCDSVEDVSGPRALRVEILPVGEAGEQLRLVCFIEQPAASSQPLTHTSFATTPFAPAAAGLHPDLGVEAQLRGELRAALFGLEQAREAQRAINEEALSVGEEYQSTNEELLASKEELQSFNEELTALNSQLQETLERQRTTSTDLQNILYSTDVATLFLDSSLRIRFFTPATRALFNIIGSDVGRPLADLHAVAADDALLDDAERVMRDGGEPSEREVGAGLGAWFNRRILPYRAPDGSVQGVVITFSDITECKHAAHAIEAAREQAEVATLAKSRFLAIASHDLRQPLQTLSLLQGLLAGLVTGSEAEAVVARLAHTLDGLSGMLDTLLDINRIDAGTIPVRLGPIDVGGMLGRLQGELGTQASAQGLGFRVVPCSLTVHSDPQLLEQMLRNLLSNALRYTATGRILLGCRRRPGLLSIEVWDTGLGIADEQLGSIFDEYRQVGNAARERRLGLGLGLSIVARLAELLGHQIRVTSRLGRGSCFAIELAYDSALSAAAPARLAWPPSTPDRITPHAPAVLLVEDDNELRSLLTTCMEQAGYAVTAAVDGVEALALVSTTGLAPDLLLSDFNLPQGISGLMLAMGLRERLHRALPVVILTGDISTQTLRAIADEHCTQLNKPVTPAALLETVRHILGAQPLPSLADCSPEERPDESGETTEASTGLEAEAPIYVVDDDAVIRAEMRRTLEAEGHTVRDFASCEAFLAVFRPGQRGCLLLDAYLPGMDGLALLARLHEMGDPLPTIMITGFSDVPIAVRAMKSGAADFISKPFTTEELLRSVHLALDRSGDEAKRQAWHEEALGRISGLTERQHEIMTLVLAGHPSKNIAVDVGISQRTVENHRASIMKRTGTRSLPELARLALAASRVGVTSAALR